MTSSAFIRTAVLTLLALAGSASAALAQGVGVKFGPTFADFNSDVLDFKTRTGVHAGLFLGGNRDGVLGVQTEINWLRKNTDTDPIGTRIRVDYLQVPVLLRLNIGADSAAGVRVYGIGGPAVDFKIADEIEGFTLDDGFEDVDVSLVFGGGIEAARIIVEGRYDRGFRRINRNFSDVVDIKKEAFTILFGIRFQ